MSCLLRLPTPLKSHFIAVFSSRNRLRALIDAICVLDCRCHLGHKNANRLHAHGSACRLVAGTQDVLLSGRDQSEGTVSKVQRENEGWFQNEATFNSVQPSSAHGCTCRENTSGTSVAFLQPSCS